MVLTVKIGTLFCGAGGKTLGAIAATGGTPVWAIEYDPEIADLYRNNISTNIIVENILGIDPRSLESPNLLLISPPCPNFSAAKVGRIETDNDRALAAKICEFITTLYPEEILIENVRGYRQSESYATIVDRLTTLGYYWDAQVFNFADFGVPQTRERLIVRASRIAPIPIVIPTHAKNPVNTIFNQQQKWVGWYEAIADLIPTLPRCELANWQKLRMESRDVPDFALVERSGARSEMQIRGADHPSFTLRAMCGKLRPNFAQANILVSGQDGIIRQGEARSFTLTAGHTVNRILLAGGGQAIPRKHNEPSVTVLANLAKGRILEDAICYRVSTPALARLQTFPDWYRWSDREQINVKAIGNSVPPLAIERILGG
jgi:DNA (cytosine-5)-methyltransferase 1